MTVIRQNDLINSIADACQYISYYHSLDFIQAMNDAYEREESIAAKDAIAQILVNSRLCAEGHRPICQDTGIVVVFLKIGMSLRWEGEASLQEMIDEGVRRAYTDADNPLRASVVSDPDGARKNTGDNTPAVIHSELVPGNTLEITLAAKGGGSENKAKFAILNPSDSVVDWVLDTVSTLGAGWCPPGILSIGIGGTPEKAMLLAKEGMMEPVNIQALKSRGPHTTTETLRLELFDKVNALGIGAQGLGGLTTVLDIKVNDYPTHAASKPVALIPNCAATRHIHFTLDGSGQATFPVPKLEDWPQIALTGKENARHVNLDTVTKSDIAQWLPGETLLLTGKLLTGRDAAHKRMVELLSKGEDLPDSVNLNGRFIYYVGPVDAVRNEAVGPAGPTTATRMDKFTDIILEKTGLIGMIGKAERGNKAIESIKRHGAVYLIATGGAAYLVSKAIRSAKVIAFPELGMEAIHEFVVEDMPVTVAVDTKGNSVHKTGPAEWQARIGGIPITTQ
ncbi:MAG: fumarate hydratase [Ectothiorhodospiraceae bacterium]|nr:fumarate hydratase [Ectothiorhodospiraceae bacterium]